MKNQKNIKLFISYSSADEALLKRLETHLKPLKRDKIIDVWCDRDITAGNYWKETINENLETADIILFLISPDSLASDYCISIEMKRAMQRHEAGEAIVIPIHLKPFDEKNFGFLNLQKLPRNKPVTQWQDQDEAFVEIAKGIREVVTNIRKDRIEQPSFADMFSQYEKVKNGIGPFADKLNSLSSTVAKFLEENWGSASLNASFKLNILKILTYRVGSEPSDQLKSAVKSAEIELNKFVSEKLPKSLAHSIEIVRLVGSQQSTWIDADDLANDLLRQSSPSKQPTVDGMLNFLIPKIYSALQVEKAAQNLMNDYWQETVYEPLKECFIQENGIEAKNKEGIKKDLHDWFQAQEVIENVVASIDFRKVIEKELRDSIKLVFASIVRAKITHDKYFVDAVNRNIGEILFFEWKYGDGKSLSISIRTTIALAFVCVTALAYVVFNYNNSNAYSAQQLESLKKELRQEFVTQQELSTTKGQIIEEVNINASNTIDRRFKEILDGYKDTLNQSKTKN